MKPGLYIIGSDIAGICMGTTPEGIGGQSLSWKKSMKSFGPWARVLLHGSEESPPFNAWRGTGYAGTETVIICDECTSTMDVMRYLVTRGLATPWNSVITVSQTAGRGQHGREWISSAGNIFASCLWPPFDRNLEAAGRWRNMASLLAGGAIADFFKKAGILVEIKWPNDLLYHDKKICGILVEDHGGSLITGIGINIESSPGDYLPVKDGSVQATSLIAAGQTFAPLDLWLEIMTGTRVFYSRMIHHSGPDIFIQWLETNLAWKSRPIIIRELPDGEIIAELIGLAPDGGLEISHNGRIEVIYNGRIFPADKAKISRSGSRSVI